MSHRIDNIDPKDTQNTSQKGFVELNRMDEGGLGFRSSCTYLKNPERLTLSYNEVAFLRTCCLGKIARRFLALRRSGMASVIKLRRYLVIGFLFIKLTSILLILLKTSGLIMLQYLLIYFSIVFI